MSLLKDSDGNYIYPSTANVMTENEKKRQELERRWYDVLTKEQRQAWITFNRYCGKDFFGEEYRDLTGMQTFINSNMQEVK